MTQTFTAAVVDEFGPTVNLRDLKLPEPGPFQALVKLVSSGICHTDLHAAEGDWPVKPEPPFVPGHEGVGIVEKVGENVSRVKVGQMVGNAWLWSACGECEHCRTGHETRCADADYGGYTQNGSFGEYMLVDTRYCPIIPEGCDPIEVAPILCAGVTVYKALKTTGVKPGQFVVISGIGGLGHIAVQYAVAMGMRVIAVDIADEKLQLASKHGAELTVNAADGDPVATIQEFTGEGAHGVLVTAVHPSAFGQAIDLSRRGGTIAFVGLPPGDFPASIFNIVFKELSVRGSLVGTRQDMEEALDFYARGLIRPTYSECRHDEINDVFQALVDGTVEGRKVIRY
ncbi:zinc-dependent alcohol dehydrogenase [Corynebacterium yudongzhengii]|uniref:Alcohol dehydrogenase n=1 Tax=Corynebacterium yudongzhengii TaxID=2080740 RepID=A0A2U1T6K8_9CORY|nr:zinc-dependent alcohol dehydrogenase [Corynebacterium yudongzhengii]AWB82200.1 zinc-dependent alcohol dehydrogenase [Corynebacterium yudongzhengii]PWC01651.1 zinc-dependent alcohol dehydrogenase [Corynebacterium yudongzhengii]